MAKTKPNLESEFNKIKQALVDIIENDEHNKLERWHMVLLHDVLTSNDNKEKKSSIIQVISLYERLQKKGLTHNSMRELRKYTRDVGLKLEF